MPEEYPRIYLYQRIVRAKLFIDTHYNESIDLDNIADEACFSKFHFLRLFKEIYGKSPHQYLIKVRIDRAMGLLQGLVSVREVCFEVGFDSPASFSSLFKRYAGISPAAYRQTQMLRQEQIRAAPLRFVPNCFAEQKGWTGNSNFEEVR